MTNTVSFDKIPFTWTQHHFRFFQELHVSVEEFLLYFESYPYKDQSNTFHEWLMDFFEKPSPEVAQTIAHRRHVALYVRTENDYQPYKYLYPIWLTLLVANYGQRLMDSEQIVSEIKKLQKIS